MTRTRVEMRAILKSQDFDAAIFDMDGVVTQTATVHAVAWKRLFDEYLTERGKRGEAGFEPFDIDRDYRRYVDGRPRYDGVEAFLVSRGISIPRGSPQDSPDRETVCGLGNRKDAYFLAQVESKGVRAFEGTVQLIRQLRDSGVKIGIFSASRHAESVLQAGGVIDLFDERIDGVRAEQLGLPGKPSPDVLLELTRRLGSAPARTAVFEDAIAGVQAGHAGGFVLVIGVNRGGPQGTLIKNGADVEVHDLSEVGVAR
jgi:trehalose 6-phosphate phosphatase